MPDRWPLVTLPAMAARDLLIGRLSGLVMLHESRGLTRRAPALGKLGGRGSGSRGGAGEGMSEGEASGVQRQARRAEQGRGLRAAVLAVAEHGVAEVLGVDTDLVRPSGL